MIECFACESNYDGTQFEARCPGCGFKGNCCEGEPCRVTQ